MWLQEVRPHRGRLGPTARTVWCWRLMVSQGSPYRVQSVGKMDAAVSCTTEQGLEGKTGWEGTVLITGSKGLG